ncbi:hypothetical protein JAAARDRAFT_131357 [Jaapia argillacea MUCL 33604]|uniref:Uncharacterized protein n=1 Tax=Jaapia argillacea MUCL 33604 TaxID=933084 RepID=A0A067PR64_9AGAM|nr:hypothetical protein JAAARDRAFT_131357 [Jaapia argillacea MUCL 33604]
MTHPHIQAILIDLSGTLHVGSTPIPASVSALGHLRSSKIPFRFCSNTLKESTEDLCQRLVEMGFDIKMDSGETNVGSREVWTSIGAVKRLIEERGFQKPFFLLSDSAKAECIEGNQAISASLTHTEMPYDGVIVGLSPNSFTYDILSEAFQILTHQHPSQSSKSTSPSSRPPIPLIATHKAKYIRPSSSAPLVLGPGPFVTALEEASGVRAEIVGKPSRKFFETVIGDMALDINSDTAGGSGRIAIVGDDVEADLGGAASELGLWRVLVKTGKYRPGDESKPGVRPPDEVSASFAEWVDSVLANRS